VSPKHCRYQSRCESAPNTSDETALRLTKLPLAGGAPRSRPRAQKLPVKGRRCGVNTPCKNQCTGGIYERTSGETAPRRTKLPLASGALRSRPMAQKLSVKRATVRCKNINRSHTHTRRQRTTPPTHTHTRQKQHPTARCDYTMQEPMYWQYL